MVRTNRRTLVHGMVFAPAQVVLELLSCLGVGCRALLPRVVRQSGIGIYGCSP